ncbi:MAG: hypothetical protein HYU28_00060 [Actinobacteria bacterium]|nr:hypothetical protein [Actinomycetota bacterium]
MLRKAVAELAGVEVLPASRPCEFTVRLAGRGAGRIRALWAGEGWPADVNYLLDQVDEAWPSGWVVTARRLSPGALDLLEQRRANWADDAGNVRLTVPPGILIDRRAHSAPRQERRGGWTESAAAVTECILHRVIESGHPDVGLRVVDLAEMAGRSRGAVTHALSLLDRLDVTERSGPARGPAVRRTLVDAPRLLDEWSEWAARVPRPSVYAHALVDDPITWVRDTLPPRMSGGSPIVSGWVAGEMLTPHLTAAPPQVQLYLPADGFEQRAARFMDGAALRPATEGGWLELWPAPDHVFRCARAADMYGVRVADLPRVYADLLRLGGRAVELATHLRSVAMRPLVGAEPGT